jgi:hypothetical protein
MVGDFSIPDIAIDSMLLIAKYPQWKGGKLTNKYYRLKKHTLFIPSSGYLLKET